MLYLSVALVAVLKFDPQLPNSGGGQDVRYPLNDEGGGFFLIGCGGT